MTAIYTDSTGLKTFWDETKKCYCFEDAEGRLLQFTITPQSGDAAKDGYTGPTIEALIACARHRIQTYNAVMPCEENRQALFGLGLAQDALYDRAERIKSEASE